MIVALFPLIALVGALVCTNRSLGLGFVAVLCAGYFNGIVRANYLSPFTTFMFDCGLLGLYVGFFFGRSRDASKIWSSDLGRWAVALAVWPIILVLIPINDFFVQLVALRATILFLPVVLIANRFQIADLVTIARGTAVLNITAFAVGLYIYQNGVESLYPKNAITQIIYASNDVGGGLHRVPSVFLTAHIYGGTMLLSLPFLIGRLIGRGVGLPERAILASGTVAALGGILLCAARQPVVALSVCLFVTWAAARFNIVIGAGAVALLAAGAYVASTDERLQRAASLEDTKAVSDRVRMSANESFGDLLVDYPAGAGMGSSFGTNIPYFLADRAPKPIGMENEYCRILIDQGWVGLGLWLGFLVWLLGRPPPLPLSAPWGPGLKMMFAVSLTSWATAFIGAGTLSSVPGTVLLMAQMGVLVRVRTGTGAPAP